MKSSAIAHDPEVVPTQSGPSFADRLTELVSGKSLAVAAGDLGVTVGALRRYLSGSIPAADVGLRIARHFSVSAEWLIEGRGGRARPENLEESSTVALPLFDTLTFGEYGKGEPQEDVLVPRWLLGRIKSTAGLWLTTMPSNALPDIATEGDTIICQDPTPPLQERRVYIFLFNGRPIVRRVFIRPEGLLLTGSSPEEEIRIAPEDTDQLMPVGRVIAAVQLNEV